MTLDQLELLGLLEKMERRVTLDIRENEAQKATTGNWDPLDLQEFQVLQVRWEQLVWQENPENEDYRVSTVARDRRDPEVSRDQSVHLGSRVCLEQSALRVKLVTQAKRDLLDRLDMQDLQELVASRVHLACQDLWDLKEDRELKEKLESTDHPDRPEEMVSW